MSFIKKYVQYEFDVVDYINNIGISNVSAIRPKVNTTYSDIIIKKDDKKSWVEIKMNHTDNLVNIRVYYQNRMWKSNNTSVVAKSIINILNDSIIAKNFILELSEFSNIPMDKIYIPTTKCGLNEPYSVSLETMRRFCDNRKTRYIIKQNDYDITDIVKTHYLYGKKEPVFYLQTGDDFFKITEDNPLDFKNDIPLFSGIGVFHVRVSTRTKFYEIQPEIKIKTIKNNSKYSLNPNTHKKHPF